jgi:hypothetical protein
MSYFQTRIALGKVFTTKKMIYRRNVYLKHAVTSDSVCLDLQNYRYSIYHECNLYGESQVLALQNTTGINSLEK